MVFGVGFGTGFGVTAGLPTRREGGGFSASAGFFSALLRRAAATLGAVGASFGAPFLGDTVGFGVTTSLFSGVVGFSSFSSFFAGSSSSSLTSRGARRRRFSAVIFRLPSTRWATGVAGAGAGGGGGAGVDMI